MVIVISKEDQEKIKRGIAVGESKEALGLPEDLTPPKKATEESKAKSQSFIFRRNRDQKARLAAGQALVGRREQLKAKGLSQIEATAQASAEQKGVSFKQVTVEEAQAAQKEVTGELEEAGAFKEPEVAREIPDIAAEGIGGVFGIGDKLPSVVALTNTALLNAVDLDKIKDFDLEEFSKTVDLMSDPFFRELIQNEVDLEVLKSGDAIASSFGSFVEAIPGVGGAAREYGGGLITTPSAQVDDIAQNLKTIESYAVRLREWIGSGTVSPEFAAEQYDWMDRDVNWLESKIKFLVIQSSELQSAPEEVNNIQDAITQTKGVIFNGRQKVGEGILRRVEPTVIQTYVTLRELKGIK